KGVGKGADLQLASITGSSVHLAQGKTAAKPASRRALDRRRQLTERLAVGPRSAFGQGRLQKALEQQLAHARLLSEVVPRVGAIEGFVAEREVRDDVAFDRRLEQRPLEPRGIAQMAMRKRACAAEPHPGENVAAEPLDER